MKTSIGTWSVIVALTLVIWVFFYVASVPLDAPQTTVVAGFAVAIVYGGKWLITLLNKRGRLG